MNVRVVRAAGIALPFFATALAITLVFAMTLFNIPTADFPALAMLLITVGGGAGLAALMLMRPAVLGRIGGIHGQLVGASLVGSLLLLAMVMAAARAMFISTHDLSVLLTMLLFAALLAIGFSLLWAGPMAARIERMREGAAQLAAGNLETALPVDGHDELAQLAEDFNRMAAALQQAAAHEREVEQARRELVAAVSHDLRTPLAVVRALLEAVIDGIVVNPEMEARYLRSAQAEILHLNQLVDDLFELAQIDTHVLHLTLERASLRDLISDTLSSFQPQAEQQGVRLLGEVSNGIDPVLISPAKMQRVLHNLIGNALRHTPSDGMILVRAEPRGRVIQVEVADTGQGIPAEDLPKIFDRSFRGEASRTAQGVNGSSGAGLGLTIARGLIEAQGGTISVDSQYGKGTCFRFTLQRA